MAVTGGIEMTKFCKCGHEITKHFANRSTCLADVGTNPIRCKCKVFEEESE